MTLRLGILGLSEGNGHPYSWSAIFNGYDPAEMESCGFPVIPRYLEEQSWPDCQISGANVSHIWTQERSLSEKVARASLIENVVDDPREMLNKVDGILLARDDSERHLEFAVPFLKAGLPIYIDKPIALSMSVLREIYSYEQYRGQIFTCSAMRYSNELQLSANDLLELGDIRQIVACTPKSWKKYAVHIVEPVLNLGLDFGEIQKTISMNSGAEYEGKVLCLKWSEEIDTIFVAAGDGAASISIQVIGTKGSRELVFKDSFPAFKAALKSFVFGISNKSIQSPREFNERVVKILELGLL